MVDNDKNGGGFPDLMASVSGLNKESKENIIMKQLQIQEELKKGSIDNIFGRINTKIYIAALLCLLLIITGIVINIMNSSSEYWNIIIPLIGATIGYIFGKGFNE
ncbi:MAG: hypothetical protein KH304_11330 [Clostridium sp.]|nr:hypothetical protein [Clostridium sp.]